MVIPYDNDNDNDNDNTYNHKNYNVLDCDWFMSIF